MTEPFLTREQLESANVFTLYQELYEIVEKLIYIWIAHFAHRFSRRNEAHVAQRAQRELGWLKRDLQGILQWYSMKENNHNFDFDVYVERFYRSYCDVTSRMFSFGVDFGEGIQTELMIEKEIPEYYIDPIRTYLTIYTGKCTVIPPQESLANLVANLQKAIANAMNLYSYLTSQRGAM